MFFLKKKEQKATENSHITIIINSHLDASNNKPNLIGTSLYQHVVLLDSFTLR